jgi:hypothetical protein
VCVCVCVCVCLRRSSPVFPYVLWKFKIMLIP